MSLKLLTLAGLLLAQTVTAETGDYRFSRPVAWQDKGQEELLAVPLDSRVYAATRDGFPDLRLVDQNDLETPYLLEKAAETKTETRRLNCESKLLGLKKKNKAIEIHLRLDKDAQSADGLTVFTPLLNFEHRVQVFGSDDGKNWSPLVKDTAIFDYSSYMPVSNKDIPLPANRFRQFKVVIEEALQSQETELLELTRTLQGEKEMERSERVALRRVPLKIDRIAFWRNQTDVLPETDKQFDYPVKEFKVTQDTKKQTTVIDVNSSREPLTGFKLHTPMSNFNRSATVKIPVKHGIETDMQVIGSAVLESLHFRDINRVQTTITFPEQRQNTYRIVISNHDNPPLEITGVTGLGNGYNLLFLPLKGKTYSLRYGSEKVKLPSYETGPIRELLHRGYKSTSTILGAEPAEKPVQESFDFAGLLNSKVFLGFVVTLMVVALGWSLIRAGKRIDQFPKE